MLLVFAKPAVAADAVFNGVRLPPLSVGAERWERDITPLLRIRNELLLSVPAAAGDAMACDSRVRVRGLSPPVIGRVTLEIVATEPDADQQRQT